MNKTLFRLGALAVVLLLNACSNTRLLNVWQDSPPPAQPLSHVLVIGVSGQEGVRRSFEDIFAAQLAKQGIIAEPIYRLYSGAAGTDTGMAGGAVPEDELKRIIQRTGADGVLVTRLIRTEQRLQVTPGAPMPMGFYGFYNYAWGYYSPPMVDSYTVALLETNVWAARSGRLLWSGTTETVDPDNSVATATDFAKVVTRALVKARLLPATAQNP